MTTMLWLTKTWDCVKKYWQIFLGFFAAIVAMILLRQKEDPAEILENANEAHKKELDAIKKSEEFLKNKSAKAEYLYQKTLKEIEEKHQKGQEALSENMREEVKRIIEDHKEDPVEITHRISALTGFVVHVEDD